MLAGGEDRDWLSIDANPVQGWLPQPVFQFDAAVSFFVAVFMKTS
jgi:hypothetical protein